MNDLQEFLSQIGRRRFQWLRLRKTDLQDSQIASLAAQLRDALIPGGRRERRPDGDDRGAELFRFRAANPQFDAREGNFVTRGESDAAEPFFVRRGWT